MNRVLWWYQVCNFSAREEAMKYKHLTLSDRVDIHIERLSKTLGSISAYSYFKEH